MAPEMGSSDHSNEVFSSIESEKLLDSLKTISDNGVLLGVSARIDNER